MSEFHDLAELPLNSGGESWGNLGYWKVAEDYSSACRDLALVLGNQLAINGHSIVMDVGFGCGDSCLLWLQHYGVAEVRGINVSQSQTARAKQHLRDHGYGHFARNLRLGSADDAALWRSGSLDETQGKPVDRVAVLDCAYHFPSRPDFFQQAFCHMADGGHIGLTDFVLHDDHRRWSLRHRSLMWMLKQSKIPAENIVTKKRYCESLEKAGFEVVEWRDISEDVLPKFKLWLEEYKKTHRAVMPWYKWLKYDVTAAFLDWAFRKRVLCYAVVTAKK